MKEYRLLRILRSMDRADIRQARKYLRADYFNKKPPVLRLFNQLVRFHPDMNSARIDEKKLFQKVFPDEAFNEKKLRRVRSKLKTTLEDFLAYQNWRADPLRKRQDLAEAYQKRNTPQLFEWTQNQVIRHLKTHKPDGVERKLQLASVYRQLYLHPHTSKVAASKENQWFTELVSNGQEGMLLILWQLACEIKVINRVDRSAHYPFLLEAAEKLLDLEETYTSPLTNIYASLYRSFIEPATPKAFGRIQKDIMTLHRAGKSEFYNLALAYKLLINQMVILTQKTVSLHPVLFTWYEEGIHSGLYLENGQLSYPRYLNIALKMIGQDDFPRSWGFITRFQDRLSETERESTVNLAKAYWHYFKYLEYGNAEDLSEAWLCTLFVTDRQFPIEMRYRSIRLRIIFEQFLCGKVERSIFQYEVRNFQHFLKGTRNFPRRQSYDHLIRWVQKLASWNNKKHPSQSQLLAYQTQIETNSEPLALEEWLLNQIQRMRKQTV